MPLYLGGTNTTKYVLTFKVSLFATNHKENSVKMLEALMYKHSRLLSEINSTVSSANNTLLTSVLTKGLLLIYKANKIGPKIEPYVIPHFISLDINTVSLISMC